MELQKTLYECYRWRANWGELVMARQRIELAPPTLPLHRAGARSPCAASASTRITGRTSAMRVPARWSWRSSLPAPDEDRHDLTADGTAKGAPINARP